MSAVTSIFAARDEFIVESQQFGDPTSGQFFMRIQVISADSYEGLLTALEPVIQRFAMTVHLAPSDRKVPAIIMVSKAPHCLVDLLYRERYQNMPIDVRAVVGNHPDLREIAEFYGKRFVHIPVTRDTKAEAEATLQSLVAEVGCDLVILARYMQILSDDFCRSMSGRIINIHHSFLPSFKGARPYAQAHARGVKLIGATSHYVTADLDEGPIIEQEVERVNHSRSVADLTALGQDIERRTLGRAVQWHAEHRVLIDGSRTVVFR